MAERTAAIGIKTIDDANATSTLYQSVNIQDLRENLNRANIKFAENVMKAGEAFLDKPLETPFIPTWNRIESAKPGFVKRLKKAVESNN